MPMYSKKLNPLWWILRTIFIMQEKRRFKRMAQEMHEEGATLNAFFDCIMHASCRQLDTLARWVPQIRDRSFREFKKKIATRMDKTPHEKKYEYDIYLIRNDALIEEMRKVALENFYRSPFPLNAE